MPLKVTGRHMTVSDEAKDYIDKKVDRLRRLLPKIDILSFTLSKEKLLVEVEATLQSGKFVAHASTKAEHTNEAIDFLVDKLEAQISKAKKKHNDKSSAAREAARVDGKAFGTPPEDEAELIAEAEEEMSEEFDEKAAEG